MLTRFLETPTPAFEGHGREPPRIVTDLRQTGAVLADAARRDPSVRIKICLDGRKDLVEITKTVKTSTTRNNF